MPEPYSPGIKIAAVARQLGVSRSWASREANAPGTRNLIAEVFALRRERMDEVFGHVLAAIEDASEARKIFVVKASLLTVGPITMPDWKR